MSVEFSAVLMEGYVFTNTDIREALTTFFRMIEENEDSELAMAIDGYYEGDTWFNDNLSNATSSAEVAAVYADAAFDYLMNMDYMLDEDDSENTTFIGVIIARTCAYGEKGYIPIDYDCTGQIDDFSVEVIEFLKAMFPEKVTKNPEILLIPHWS